MKKNLLLLFFLSSSYMGFSQKDVSKYRIGIYGGLNFPYCDIDETQSGMVLGVNAGYKIQAWLSLYLDVQYGLLRGGNNNNNEELPYMDFTNRYIALAVQPRFYFMNIRGYNPSKKYLNGLYVSAGAGMIINNVTAHNPGTEEAGYLNDNQDKNIILPLELGYTVPLMNFGKEDISIQEKVNKKYLSLHIAGRYNVGFSDSWDGYDPRINQNKSNDGFASIIAGLVYSF